ncbi:phosphate-starvation-inducible PsiE family protein [Clostridium taeniosporum]|uniref:Transporter n=1 Tax=Clostridium taeniosporum TaxID=394958 RepID=A0A1D7XKE2_9CLOT|nr:phosphate-starvation-inducible PsiE family protein [Clostridium taeniosporum]AOR23569.1 hypothetical protein BGI42_07410 [Clostridium taeniosporum]
MKKQIYIKIAHYFEAALAIVVMLLVLLSTIDVLKHIFNIFIINSGTMVEYQEINDLLGQIFLLIIGIELVIMLSLHTPDTIVEVLLYAIARKLLLLPKEGAMVELLLGVIAIAGLFMIRRYLINKNPLAEGKD